MIAYDVILEVRKFCAPHVFADRDKFHFRRDDAGFGIVKLGDGLAVIGAQWLAAFTGEAGEFEQAI